MWVGIVGVSAVSAVSVCRGVAVGFGLLWGSALCGFWLDG